MHHVLALRSLSHTLVAPSRTTLRRFTSVALSLAPVFVSAALPACSADASRDALSSANVDGTASTEGLPICSINTPPGTKCQTGGTTPLPLIEYETATATPVGVTIGYMTPRGAIATTITVSPYTPGAAPIASISDAAAVSHSQTLGGLTPYSVYRYDVWMLVNGTLTDVYSSSFSTMAAPGLSIVATANGTEGATLFSGSQYNGSVDQFSVTWGSAELKTVPTLSNGPERLHYSALSTQTEVGLANYDPTLAHQANLAILATGDVSLASLQSWADQDYGAVHAVFPFPNQDAFGALDGTNSIDVGVGGAWGSYGSMPIKSVRIWDAGLCEGEVQLQPVLQKIHDSISAQLGSATTTLRNAIPSGVEGNVNFGFDGRIGVFNTHQTGVPTNQGGGIIAAFSGDISIDYVGSEKVSLVYDIPIVAVNGMLTLQPGVAYSHDVGTGLPSLWGSDGQSALLSFINGQVLGQIKSQGAALAAQQAVTFGDCDPTAPNFVGPQFIMGSAVGAGGIRLGLPQATINAGVAMVHDNSKWACFPTDPKVPTSGTAGFLLPAKRVNWYPDAIGLVWFDSPDITLPGYVAYLATHGTPDVADVPAAVAALCSWSPALGFSAAKPSYERFPASISL